MPPVNNKTLTRKQQDHKMKKQLLLIAILFCAVYTQAQEVFVNADFVSSYIWRGMDSGNASVQPSLGFNWKGLTVYAWGRQNSVIRTTRLTFHWSTNIRTLPYMPTTILLKRKTNLSNISIIKHTPPDILSKPVPDTCFARNSRFR